MPQRHFTAENIMFMLIEGNYSSEDIQIALRDLETIRKNISVHDYHNLKALLENKLNNKQTL